MYRKPYGLKCRNTSRPLCLTNISNDVTICDTVASVKSNLLYKNEESATVEAEFIFPMDDDSAVYQFEVEIDGRHVVGECQDKEQAKESYREAVNRGHSAFLLHEDDTAGDIFHISVGSLPAGKTARIKFAYVVQLGLDGEGAVRFVLPGTLNPRYTPSDRGKEVRAQGTSVLSAHQTAIPIQCDFHFNAQIVSRLQVKDVVSRFAPIRWKREEHNRISVTLQNPFNNTADLDLCILYENPHRSVLTLEPGAKGKTGILQNDVIMVNFYPDIDTSTTTANCEFIFIVDRSGSMRGNNINQVKGTLLLFLKSLPVGCYFNIVSFGNNFSALFPESQEYNEQTLEQAISLHKDMDADMGGTEIMRPLKHIFENMTRKENYPRQLFVLTDGMVSNTQAVIKLVKAHANHTRLFAFGIGTGVSTSLVKGIARAGKGKAEFVTGSDRLQPKIISCLKLATQPSVTSVSVEWCVPKGFTVKTVPESLPVLLPGEHLVVYGVVSKDDPSSPCTALSVVLRARIGDQSIEERLGLSKEAEQNPDLLLHRMAAKMQIKQLELTDVQLPGNSTSTTKQQIVLLSLASNIVSKYTAFFGVDMMTKQRVYDQKGISLWHLSAGLDNAYEYMHFDDYVCHYKKERSSYAACSGYFGQALSAQRTRPQPPLLVLCCASESRPHKTEGNISAFNVLESVISLQSFNGSWELTDGLLKLLQTKSMETKSPVKNTTVWATILVITWLKKRYINKADEWEMIAGKAKNWLQRQTTESSHSMESLAEVAEEYF